MIRFRVRTEMRGARSRLDNYHNQGRRLLTSEALKDSNYFAPQRTGNLIASSQRSTDFEKGKLVWDTKYARKLYFNPQYKFSKDKNPNARGLWFEAAKARFLNRWVDVLDALRRRNI